MSFHINRRCFSGGYIKTRYFLSIQYYGPAFCGWKDIHLPQNNNLIQDQLTLPSIYTTLFNAANNLIGYEKGYNSIDLIKISSRTDAKVHAIRNVVQIDIIKRMHDNKGKGDEILPYTSKNVLNGMNYHLNKAFYKNKRVHSHFHVCNPIQVCEVSMMDATHLPNTNGSHLLEDDITSILDNATNPRAYYEDSGDEPMIDVRESACDRSYVYYILANNHNYSSSADAYSIHRYVERFGGDMACFSDSQRRATNNCFSLFGHDLAWKLKNKTPLDFDKMRDACQYLVGTRDFSSVRSSKCQSVTPFRDVSGIDIFVKSHDTGTVMNSMFSLEHNPMQFELVCIKITATSYVQRMVRNIVGLLVAVGESAITPSDVQTIMEAKDRMKNPTATAPAHGLYLHSVNYSLSHDELERRRQYWYDTIPTMQ